MAVFFTNFGEYPQSFSLPPDWDKIGGSSMSGVVEIALAQLGGKILRVDPTGERVIFKNGYNAANVEVYAKLKNANTSTSIINGLGVRASGLNLPTGYFMLAITTSYYRLLKSVNGTYIALASTIYVSSVKNDYVHMRLSAQGNVIRCKMWTGVDDGIWDREITDNSISDAGASGIWTSTYGVTVDAFGVGTDGDVAPTEPPKASVDIPVAILTMRTYPATTAPMQITIPSATLMVQVFLPPNFKSIDVPPAQFSASGYPPEQQLSTSVPLARMQMAALAPALLLHIPDNYPAQRVFRLRITKTGLDDLIVPFSNISVRASRDDRQSSLTATVPGLTQLDGISARVAGGRLRFDAGIKTAAGTTWLELLNVPLGTPRFDNGPKNKSLTLVGNGLQTLTASKNVVIDAMQYRSYSGGKRSLRRHIDWNLSVSDTLTDDGSTWVIGEIAYSVQASPPSESMTVTEM